MMVNNEHYISLIKLQYIVLLFHVMVNDEHYTLLINYFVLLFHMMVNNEHYISLIKLACAAVPYI